VRVFCYLTDSERTLDSPIEKAMLALQANRTRKRNQWGQQQQQASRPESDWIDVPAPELQIVSPDTWAAAHARLEAVRGVYLISNQAGTIRTEHRP
jgi:hypothetical protein